MIRRAAAISTALAALAALAGLWRVHVIRAGVLASLDAPMSRVFSDFAAEALVIQVAGSAVLALLLIRAIAGVVQARREGQAPAAIAGQLAPLSILAFAGVALLRSALALRAYEEPCLDPDVAARFRYETFASHAAPLEGARFWLLGLAVLGSTLIVGLARRNRQEPGPSGAGAMLASVALFSIGLAVFLMTRAMAHDASHPPPLWNPAGGTGFRSARLAELPSTKTCTPARDAPHITWAREGWYVDGVAARDEAALRQRLVEIEELWQRVQPGKVFPGHAALAIPSSAPTDSVSRALEAMRAAGYLEADMLGRMEAEPWPTETLGMLEYPPRICRATVQLPAKLPDGKTWGDISPGIWPR